MSKTQAQTAIEAAARRENRKKPEEIELPSWFKPPKLSELTGDKMTDIRMIDSYMLEIIKDLPSLKLGCYLLDCDDENVRPFSSTKVFRLKGLDFFFSALVESYYPNRNLLFTGLRCVTGGDGGARYIVIESFDYDTEYHNAQTLLGSGGRWFKSLEITLMTRADPEGKSVRIGQRIVGRLSYVRPLW